MQDMMIATARSNSNISLLLNYITGLCAATMFDAAKVTFYESTINMFFVR